MLYDTKWDRPVVDAVGQDLLNAAEYIERHGWCQSRAFDGDRACMVGAIYAATGGIGRGARLEGPNMRFLCSLMRVALVAPNQAAWNDDPVRTKQEVIDALRQAAYLKGTV
jgi:hypothetical protein